METRLPANLAIALLPKEVITEDSVYSSCSTIVFGAFMRKRLFDIVFAALVAVFLLSWLVPLIAICIKWESRGPVFFRQLRTGKGGKPFYCLKFRSMHISADAHSKQASRGDSRITKVGAFLRKTSLDELPQFLNVLQGEMSVVGPRPHMLRHTEDYARVVEHFMDRHLVMPGITGLAQVSGYRGETKEVQSMVQRVKADLRYLRHWSFMLDLKIMLLTVLQTFKKNENAF